MEGVRPRGRSKKTWTAVTETDCDLTNMEGRRYGLYEMEKVTTKTVFRTFSGTIQLSQCQKRTSGLYGARED